VFLAGARELACAIEHAFSSLCPPVLATVPVGQSTPPFTVVLNWMAALKKIKLPALRVLSPVLTVVCFLDEVCRGLRGRRGWAVLTCSASHAYGLVLPSAPSAPSAADPDFS